MKATSIVSVAAMAAGLLGMATSHVNGETVGIDCTLVTVVPPVEQVCTTVTTEPPPPPAVDVGTTEVTIPPPVAPSPVAPPVVVPVVPLPTAPADDWACTATDPGTPTCDFTATGGAVEVEVVAVLGYVTGGAGFTGAGYSPPQRFGVVLPTKAGSRITLRAVGGSVRARNR